MYLFSPCSQDVEATAMKDEEEEEEGANDGEEDN
jgi:hypothetical protein